MEGSHEKFIATVHTMGISTAPNGNFTSLNNSIVLYAHYVHNLFGALAIMMRYDRDRGRTSNWFSRTIIGVLSFAPRKRFQSVILSLHRSGCGCDDFIARKQQKRQRNATHIHIRVHLARSLFEEECSIHGSAHDFFSLFFFFYLAVDRTRWTYANSERMMKVITLKFGWLIFIRAAQLPPGLSLGLFLVIPPYDCGGWR